MQTKWKNLLCLLLAALLLAGCASGETAAQTEPTLSREAFLEDYDQLWRDLEENYPFFPILEEKGVDVASVREDYRMYIQKTADLDTFMAVLDRMFGKLQNFAHLYLFPAAYYDGMLLAIEEWEGDDFAPWEAVLMEETTARTYAALPRKESTVAGEAPAVELDYYPELSAAYFRFPTMNLSARDRDAGIIAEYLSQLPPVEHIIFDITGNPGGSDMYWEPVIMAPFGGQWQGSYRIFYQDSPINARFYGARERKPIPTGEIPDFARELKAAYYEEAVFERDFGQSTLTNGAEAKRWVITDGGYSAAESFAAFCKLTGWATLVGRPTRGDGLGGNPLLLPLKNTGLLVYLTTAMAENPDGTLNAAQGVTPDHTLLPKDDRTPLEFCLDLIENS